MSKALNECITNSEFRPAVQSQSYQAFRHTSRTLEAEPSSVIMCVSDLSVTLQLVYLGFPPLLFGSCACVPRPVGLLR